MSVFIFYFGIFDQVWWFVSDWIKVFVFPRGLELWSENLKITGMEMELNSFARH